MHSEAIYAWFVYALYVPFCLIAMILAHYAVLRARCRRRHRLGKERPGFYPSAVALGLAFQFLQVFHRPSMVHVVEARQQAKEEADEDDNGDPESPAARLRQFHRQLRRIRLGEPVKGLVWRL